MTLAQLLDYFQHHTKFEFMQGDAQQTLDAARSGSHQHQLAAEMVVAIAAANHCESAAGEVVREVTVKSLGPLRLKYMADDAPVDGFRMLEHTVVAIDDAFNAEALAAKRAKE
ncbi:MAG: hypothetical protein OEW58_04610 [Gammaproteobacteria bacterium]|nr:hypothetical protein [Gammaproteobacteria bacterium]